MTEDIDERAARAVEENEVTREQLTARDLAKGVEGSEHIRREGVRAADRLDEGDLSEHDAEALSEEE